MAVSVQREPAFRPSRPRTLFEGPYLSTNLMTVYGTSYDIAPDGEHFVMIESPQTLGGGELNVVLDWFDELGRLAPSEN